MKPFKRSINILTHYPFLYLFLLPLPLGIFLNYVLQTMHVKGSFFVAIVNFAIIVGHALLLFPVFAQHLHDITMTGESQPQVVKRTIAYHWYKPLVLTLILSVIGFVLYFPYITFQVLEKSTILLKIIAVPIVCVIPMVIMLALPICFDLGVGVIKGIKLAASIFYRYLGRLIPLLLVMALAVAVPNIMTLAFYLEKVAFPENTRYFYLLNAITALVCTVIRLWVYTYLFVLWDSIREKWSK